MTKFLSALRRSWEFTIASFVVLISDFGIAIYPLISILVGLQLTFAFVYPLFSEVLNENNPSIERRAGAIIVLLLFYVIINLASVLANAFLIATLNKILDAKLNLCHKNSNLEMVLRSFSPLVIYSLVISFLSWFYMNVRLFVGFLLGLIVFPILGGKILGKPQKQAYQILLLLSLPVIVLEGVSFKSSVEIAGNLLLNTWGEKLVRKYSQGLLFLFTVLPIIIILVGKNLNSGITTQNELLIIQAGESLLPIIIITTNIMIAIDSIFGLAAYRYATKGCNDVYKNSEIPANALVTKPSK
jgi:hypothetical protein